MREIVFVNIVQKLSATFGNPKYIDRYYGYIWSINQKYISFNIIETGYQIEEMYVYIFKKLPPCQENHLYRLYTSRHNDNPHLRKTLFYLR